MTAPLLQLLRDDKTFLNTPKLTIERSRPLQRHLRRSLNLRSPNFSHGLPQV